ncbi:MAG: hypothetical protein IH999_05620 [Proteobacteria bacterium]|nr:hypothetical protein [Pseudomonadota bacterium]
MTGTMSEKPSGDSRSEQEAQRRMDAALRLALNTPHKPHKPKADADDSKVSSKRRRKKGRGA